MLAFSNPELLNDSSQLIHNQAVLAAKKYLVAEAELLAAIMRVARKSHEIPSLGLAVEGGLSLTKAKTIASVITTANQGEWIEKAQNLSKAKLEKEVATANPAPHHVEKAKPVGENRNRIEFELNDEVMERQRRAVDLISQKLGKSASLRETQEYLLECFLNHGDPVMKAERAELRRQNRAQGTKEKQEKSTDRSRERPGDRSDLQTHTRAREAKAIPAPVRHEVFNRDRGCCQASNPDGSACLNQRWVHLHHIHPRARGGPDTAENLITLCSRHHRLWHEREA